MKCNKLVESPLVVEATLCDNPTITSLCYDSRKVEVGTLFFAVAGFAVDGNKFVDIASDEHQAILKWTKLHNEYQLPLYLCATAAEKYGICCNQTDAEDKTSCNLNEIFSVSGLGELVELSSKANRMVQF